MIPQEAPKTVEISTEIFLDLLHWARRYVDGRKTWVPSEFNNYYKQLAKQHPWLTQEQSDKHVCPSFPYAESGNLINHYE